MNARKPLQGVTLCPMQQTAELQHMNKQQSQARPRNTVLQTAYKLWSAQHIKKLQACNLSIWQPADGMGLQAKLMVN